MAGGTYLNSFLGESTTPPDVEAAAPAPTSQDQVPATVDNTLTIAGITLTKQQWLLVVAAIAAAAYLLYKQRQK